MVVFDNNYLPYVPRHVRGKTVMTYFIVRRNNSLECGDRTESFMGLPNVVTKDSSATK